MLFSPKLLICGSGLPVFLFLKRWKIWWKAFFPFLSKNFEDVYHQSAFACSKLAKETRTSCEICWELASFWCRYCQLWTCFTPCSSASVVNIEHVITAWVTITWFTSTVCWYMIPQKNIPVILYKHWYKFKSFHDFFRKLGFPIKDKRLQKWLRTSLLNSKNLSIIVMLMGVCLKITIAVCEVITVSG